MFRIYGKAFFAVALLAGCAVPAPALQLASRDTQDWIETLERPERIKNQKVEEVIAAMDLKPGMVVADLGAGSGIFARPFAKAVGPQGKVYAVDIDPGLLDYINERAKKENVTNIKTVLGEFSDPKIPAQDVDVAFFNDVLHHIENRAAYLKALARYIKPTGQVVIIEMNKEDPKTPHRDKPDLLLSREQVDQWMADAGFRPGKENKELFPGTKHFLFYGRK